MLQMVKSKIRAESGDHVMFVSGRVKSMLLPLSLLSFVAGCGDVGSDNATVSEEAPSTEPATDFKIGDAVNFDAFEITVKTVEQKKSVGPAYMRESVAEGGTYVAVTYSLKNTGKKPIGMFDGPSLKLIDPTGTNYDPDIGASSSYSAEKDFNNKVLSDLNPGIKVNNGAVWEVSKESFDPSTWKVVLEGHENSPIALK